MKPARLLIVLLNLLLAAQTPPPRVKPLDEDVKLPDGKSQREEILKAEHKKSLEDVAELLKLAEELKAELEKNERHVVSLKSVKQTEEIEKLARRIKGRLKRY